ncbi:MAG: response regulator [Acaryochloridaceae cyanobacterium RU_4_10]|nr:response regulator [Acaryochloridaceae cyanobacterium RU_4_10]
MKSAVINKPIEILLVEDNPGDVELTTLAFEESQLQVHLNVVEDGVAALEFLHQQSAYAKSPYPDMVLLDLNLPKKSGHEVLAEIKADENFRRIPVVILTTSLAEEDVLRAYNHYANCYLKKPVGFSQFIEVIKSIEDFWFKIVRLPSS